MTTPTSERRRFLEVGLILTAAVLGVLFLRSHQRADLEIRYDLSGVAARRHVRALHASWRTTDGPQAQGSFFYRANAPEAQAQSLTLPRGPYEVTVTLEFNDGHSLSTEHHIEIEQDSQLTLKLAPR